MRLRESRRLTGRIERKFFPRIRKAIQVQISSLMEVLKSEGTQAAIRETESRLTNSRLRAEVERMMLSAALAHARLNERRLRKSIGKSTGFMLVKRFAGEKDWERFIKDYLNQYLTDKFTWRVPQTTREIMLRVLHEAVEQGLGVDEIVKRMDEIRLAEYQAARIVRTEVNRAANVGVLAQGEGFGYELQKEWISVHDARTRGRDPEDQSDHYSMDGQRVDFYDVFRDPRSGATLRHPGDPEAPGKDTINCRCQMTTTPKRDSRGRLVPRRSRITVIPPGGLRPPRAITV